jgi:hypothetical protein
MPVETRVKEYLAGVWNTSKFGKPDVAEAEEALEEKIEQAERAEAVSSVAQKHVKDQLVAILAMKAPNNSACYPHCHPPSWYLPEGLQLDRPLKSAASRIMDHESMTEDGMVNRVLSDPMVLRSKAGWDQALNASRRAFRMLKLVRKESADLKDKPHTKALPAEFQTPVNPGTAINTAEAANAFHKPGVEFPLWTTQESLHVPEDQISDRNPLDKSAILQVNPAATASLVRRNGLKGSPGDVIYDWVKVQKIAVVGDESVCGVCTSDVSSSFPKRLQSVLQTERFKVEPFCQPGATASNIMEMASMSTIFSMKPDVIAIMLGTNVR